MRPILVIVTAAALAAGTLGTGPAGAHPSGPDTVRADRHKPLRTAVALGQVGTGICNPPSGPAAAVVDTQATGQASYVAPARGVITSFSHLANGQPGKIQLIVFADGATATQKVVAAKSAKVTVTTNTLNTFATQVPIKAKQKIGIGWSATGMACATAADYPGDVTLVKGAFDADTTTLFVADGVLSNGAHSFRPNIAAILEPDRDKDGFGDLTQDGCPASRKIQLPCPDTKITKRPGKLSTRTRARVKVRFTSTTVGATFQCRLDGHKRWKACDSPFKKRLGPGTHLLQVRAVGPNGVPDPKPAKVRFTIRKG